MLKAIQAGGRRITKTTGGKRPRFYRRARTPGGGTEQTVPDADSLWNQTRREHVDAGIRKLALAILENAIADFIEQQPGYKARGGKYAVPASGPGQRRNPGTTPAERSLHSVREREAYRRAEDWLMKDDRAEGFIAGVSDISTVEGCCEILGLKVGYIRRGLEKFRAS